MCPQEQSSATRTATPPLGLGPLSSGAAMDTVAMTKNTSCSSGQGLQGPHRRPAVEGESRPLARSASRTIAASSLSAPPSVPGTSDALVEFMLPTLQVPTGLCNAGVGIDELQSLQGPHGSTLEANILALTGGMPPLIQTRRLSTATNKPCRRWRWQPFTNSARNDQLTLYHWSADSDASDSLFAAQGVKPPIMTYTDEEYESFLQDPSWTKEETDQLFALCVEFELRFFVIADRFEYVISRSIEDMKDRYYSVSRTLVLARHGAQDAQSKLLSSKFSYDKPREVERKRLLEKLFSRTPAQIQEEEIIMLELKRRSLNEGRWFKDRESILRSLMNNELPVQQASSTPLPPSVTDTKKKRRSIRGDEALISTPTSVDAVKNIRRDRAVEESPLRKEKVPSGVHLRSTRYTTIKVSLQAKVTAMLAEYGISVFPSMPTSAVCAKFEDIRQAIVSMIEGKRLLDRIEHEHKVTLIRKTTLKDGLEGNVKPAVAAPPLFPQKRPLMSPPTLLRDNKRPRN
ncbi:hypothetical protein BASA60_000935 [Batrachochytrium salamandrivorans]|nr:hypothetical protein BASA62_008831 [Batrachochytrium salamandrivorans]KAH6584534.1 hypothetical protein BASA60_000935 [Batrachochytrium salamandrivorans]